MVYAKFSCLAGILLLLVHDNVTNDTILILCHNICGASLSAFVPTLGHNLRSF